MTTRTRAAATALLALVTSVLLAAPASADTSDGAVLDQQVQTMSTGEIILIFVGIPVVFALLVWIVVSAPSWTRGGRPDDTEAWTGEAVVVGAGAPAAAVEAGAASAAVAGTAEDSGSTGGTSAGW